jgi:hypothetical protein
MTNTHEARQEWWEKPGRMEDLEQRFKPDGLLRLARSTPEYYDSHGHYLPGLAVLALTYHADLVEARAVAEQIHAALAEANVPRSEGVGEPLFSDAHRVRLLYQDRDEARAQVERMREALDEIKGNVYLYRIGELPLDDALVRAIEESLVGAYAAVPDPEEDSDV